MDERSAPGFATRAIHAEREVTRQSSTAGDVATPIHLSSTYALESVPVDTSITDFDPAAGEYLYTRLGNPTRQALESRIAALTGATHGFAFASGTAAVVATVMATVSAGASIVAFDDLYGGSVRVLEELVDDRLGIDVRFVDARDVANVESAIDETTELVLMETPTNPLLRLCDIEAIADVSAEYEVPLAVDNTFASPALQRPLALGADVEIHSATKYLNGHSDGLGGVAVTDDAELADDLAFVQRIGLGTPLNPVGAFHVLRGLKTLEVRMDRQCDNAAAVAAYLDDHERVDRVIYPGLEHHPQHALATRQMDRPGAMLSFDLAGSPAQAVRFLEALETFTLAVSLGGVESLVELPAVMTHEAMDDAKRRAHGITDTLIRVSVGIEAIDDLIADLDRGFAAAVEGNH